jgi:hypothetical protein
MRVIIRQININIKLLIEPTTEEKFSLGI